MLFSTKDRKTSPSRSLPAPPKSRKTVTTKGLASRYVAVRVPTDHTTTVSWVGLQEKLETRERLEIDSLFSSTRDQLENK